jgi:PAS domain S-box-containing protein
MTNVPAAAARKRSPRLLIPLAVLGVSLAVTFAAAGYVAWTAAARDRTRFQNSCLRTEGYISQWITTYEYMLNGGAALFSVDPIINRDQFHSYVQRLNLATHYPGIQGVGVSLRIPRAFRRPILERMRREWGDDLGHRFDITPFDPARDEHHSIIYLEPEDRRNLPVVGFDMSTEPTRWAAMQKARDTAAAAMSGKVRLKQEIGPDAPQAGFLIYVPVYYRDDQVGVPGATQPATSPASQIRPTTSPTTQLWTPPATIAERQKRLAGFVYAPFRGDDLLRAILPSDATGNPAPTGGVDFTIYDGDQVSPEAILYRSERSAGDPNSGASARYTATRKMDMPGKHAWTIVYASGDAFEANSLRGVTLMVLGAGGVVSFILFGLTAAQAEAHRRTETAAQSLRVSASALRASESRFRRLVDSNLIGVVFSTLDGRVLDGNDEYFRIVGRKREDVQRGDIRWDTMTPPEFREIDKRAVDELLATGVCTPFEKEFERPEGTRVPVLVGVAMLEGSEDETVAMYLDLTARKEAEREIIRAKEVAEAARVNAEQAQAAAETARAQAEEASRLKDDFLATVSHELRTPLNAILGWAQLLRGGTHDDPQELNHGLETIERSAKAQAQLIDDLLDVSRIVAGKLRLDVKVVELTRVIEAALASVRPAGDAKGVRITHVLDPDASLVNGDADRLQQIVWNLLSNAVKFTPRGGMVQVVLRRDESQAQLVVSDTGVGIRGTFLPHVFERFRQADASTTRRFGGLGLGLGIVRHLTELHGGTVRAESDGDGKGSTFIVTLPLALATVRAGTERSAAPGRSIPSPGAGRDADSDRSSLQGVRVLLAEDDPDARDLITRILHDRGAEVTASNSASAAITAFRSARPDVLISDIGMPDEDGYALIARVRALEIESAGGTSVATAPRVPAIALTALARAEDRRRAILAGFQLHLSKPIEPAELAAAVANLATSTASGSRSSAAAAADMDEQRS